jgi:hypothetical protein
MQSSNMRRLIETVLKCSSEKLPIENNSQVHELIDLLSHSSDEEFKSFLNDFEVEMINFPANKLETAQNMIEFICLKVSELKSSRAMKVINLMCVVCINVWFIY